MCQDTSEIAAEQSRVADIVDVEKSLEKNISNWQIVGIFNQQ